MSSDPIQQGADYIYEQTEKLDAPISYAVCLTIAAHLHHMWSGQPEPKLPQDIAHTKRKRYDGDNWDDGDE